MVDRLEDTDTDLDFEGQVVVDAQTQQLLDEEMAIELEEIARRLSDDELSLMASTTSAPETHSFVASATDSTGERHEVVLRTSNPGNKNALANEAADYFVGVSKRILSFDFELGTTSQDVSVVDKGNGTYEITMTFETEHGFSQGPDKTFVYEVNLEQVQSVSFVSADNISFGTEPGFRFGFDDDFALQRPELGGRPGEYPFGPTGFTVTNGTSEELLVSDDDSNFDIKLPFATQIPQDTGAPQVLAADTTIDGTTYNAGTAVYTTGPITLTDEATGRTYTAVGIAVGESEMSFDLRGEDNNIVGYAFVGDLPPPGVALSFLEVLVPIDTNPIQYDALAGAYPTPTTFQFGDTSISATGADFSDAELAKLAGVDWSEAFTTDIFLDPNGNNGSLDNLGLFHWLGGDTALTNKVLDVTFSDGTNTFTLRDFVEGSGTTALSGPVNAGVLAQNLLAAIDPGRFTATTPVQIREPVDPEPTDQTGSGTLSYFSDQEADLTAEQGEKGDGSVEVAPHGRHLADDASTSEADGIISGDTDAERTADARVERTNLIWRTLLQETDGVVPSWGAEQWFNLALGLHESGQDGESNLINPLNKQNFFNANFNSDGEFTGRLDASGNPTGEVNYSVLPQKVRADFELAIGDAAVLFHSAQQTTKFTGTKLPDGSDFTPGVFILPENDADAVSTFLSAYRKDALDLGQSEFVSSGNKWQEFLATGIVSEHSILNGRITEDDLANDALTKATMWVGRDVIAELGDQWTGPSAADLDRADIAHKHKVWQVTYYKDGQKFSRLVTGEHKDLLSEQESAGEIDGYGQEKVEDPIQVRMFWAQRALAHYDALRTPVYNGSGDVVSGASAADRLAQAFYAIYTHYEDLGVLETESFKSLFGHTHHGSRLNPLLDTSAIDTGRRFDDDENLLTDKAAKEFLFEKIGGGPIADTPELAVILSQWKGATNITRVAGHFAQHRQHHPDHRFATMSGNGDHAEEAGDKIVNALKKLRPEFPDKKKSLAYTLSRETADDIRHNRLVLGLEIGALVAVVAFTAVLTVVTAGAAAPALEAEGEAGVELTLLNSAGEAAADDAVAVTVTNTPQVLPLLDQLQVAGSVIYNNPWATPRVIAYFASGMRTKILIGTAVAAGGSYHIYTTASDGSLKLVRPIEAADDDNYDAGDGGTLGDNLKAINIALEVSNIFADPNRGLDDALSYLKANTDDAHPGEILNVIQYLDEAPRNAIVGRISDEAESDFDSVETLIDGSDLTTDAGVRAVASFLNGAPDATVQAALIQIARTQRTAAAAQSVLGAMTPESAASVLLHDLTLASANVSSGDAVASKLTTLQDVFLSLAESNPERAGEIFYKIGEIDVDSAARLLLNIAYSTQSDSIPAFLNHVDSAWAAGIMNAAFDYEADFHGDDFEPSTESKILDLPSELIEDGEKNGLLNVANATVAGFAVLLPPVESDSEDLRFAGLDTDDQEAVNRLIEDPFELYEGLGSTDAAAEIAFEGLTRLGSETVTDLIFANSTSTGGSGPDISNADITEVLLSGGQRSIAYILDLSDSNPILAGTLLSTAKTLVASDPARAETVTAWETSLENADHIGILGTGEDLRFVVETLAEISGVEEDIVGKLFAGELTLEEGTEGGAYLIASSLFEVLSDPSHANHAKATEVLDRIEIAAKGAHEWSDQESNFISDMFSGATTAFRALSSVLSAVASPAEIFVTGVADTVREVAFSKYLWELGDDALETLIPNFEETEAYFEGEFAASSKEFIESVEGLRLAKAEGLDVVDGQLVDSSGRKLQEEDRNSWLDRHFRLDIIGEVTVNIPNLDSSIFDNGVALRFFWSPPRRDEDGHRHSRWRIAIVSGNPISSNAQGFHKDAAGNFVPPNPRNVGAYAGLSSVREYSLNIYKDGIKIRDLIDERHAIKDDRFKETQDVAQLKTDLDDLNGQVTAVENELGRLDGRGNVVGGSSELSRVNDRLGTNQSGIEDSLAIFPTTPAANSVVQSYNALAMAWEDRDDVYADPNSTAAAREGADDAVALAMADFSAAVTGTETAVAEAQAVLDRINGITNSTQAEKDIAQQQLAKAIDASNEANALSGLVTKREGYLEHRLEIRDDIEKYEDSLNGLKMQRDAAEKAYETAHAKLQTNNATRDKRLDEIRDKIEDHRTNDTAGRTWDWVYTSVLALGGKLATSDVGSQNAVAWIHNKWDYFFGGGENQILSIEDAKSQFDEAVAQRDADQTAVDTAHVGLQESQQAVASASQELNGLYGQLRQAEQDLEEARIALDQETNNRDALMAERHEVQQKIDANDGEVELLDIRLNTLDTQIAQADQSVEAVQQRIEHLGAEIANSQVDLATAEVSYEQALNTVADLSTNANATDAEIQAAQDALRQAAGVLGGLQERFTSSESVLRLTKRALEGAKASVSELEGERSYLKDRLKEVTDPQEALLLQAQIASLEGQIETGQNNVQVLQGRVQATEQRIVTLEVEISRAEQNYLDAIDAQKGAADNLVAARAKLAISTTNVGMAKAELLAATLFIEAPAQVERIMQDQQQYGRGLTAEGRFEASAAFFAHTTVYDLSELGFGVHLWEHFGSVLGGVAGAFAGNAIVNHGIPFLQVPELLPAEQAKYVGFLRVFNGSTEFGAFAGQAIVGALLSGMFYSQDGDGIDGHFSLFASLSGFLRKKFPFPDSEFSYMPGGRFQLNYNTNNVEYS